MMIMMVVTVSVDGDDDDGCISVDDENDFVDDFQARLEKTAHR